MEDHVVLVKQWKKDQRLTRVQTEEERKEEERKKKEEERMKKKEDAFDSYYQGKRERKYSTERSRFRTNERGPGDRYQNWDPPRRQVAVRDIVMKK